MVAAILPRVGLVTDSDLNRHTIKRVLTAEGYEIPLCVASAALNAQLAAGAGELDAWLLDLHADNVQPVLEALTEFSQVPLLLNDEVPPENDIEAYEYWARRLLEKLEVVAVPNVEDGEQKTLLPEVAHAEQVWVLGASLGGPEAVARFLDALPAGLPIALVYAQHIEASFDKLLATSVSRRQAYPMHLARGEQQLNVGEVMVVPADRQLRFLPRGRVVETRRAWVGSFQPVIDQVISELARVYRKNLGVIIFTGTCNDGEVGCRVVKASGGRVWVQSPESCVSAAMPSAAISTGCVSFQGTPEALALSLAKQYAIES
jgi:chemosensory pili system protein ChpB (putative protein-glutamate methylesterase)